MYVLTPNKESKPRFTGLSIVRMGSVRERIGPSKVAATARLLEIRKALVEERHVDRDKNASVSLGQLFDWFLNLQEIQGWIVIPV